MKHASNRRPPRPAMELVLEKLGLPMEEIANPAIKFTMNNHDFKIVQSELEIPSKLEISDGENIILLNNVAKRSSKELLFDIYQCVGHILIPAQCVPISVKEPNEWLIKNDINVPDRQDLILEMACDHFAIDQIKYNVPSPNSVLKDVNMDICKMMMPDFVTSLIGKICRQTNEAIAIRRRYMSCLFQNSKINKRDDKKSTSQKKLVDLDKSFNQLAEDYGYTEKQKINIEIPILFDVCIKLKCKPNKMDSFDKSMSRIMNDVEWSKIPMSIEIQDFIKSWVKPEYAKYRRMVSELERTPQRKLISKVLFEIVCRGVLPSEILVEKVKREMKTNHIDRQGLVGLSSYNERKAKAVN